jgi:endogenous inhibitor of DNA gyrase (YacG/DUF329 family)
MKRTDTSDAVCSVCGARTPYEHEGKFFCVRNSCQLVAAGQWTRDQARTDLIARGYTISVN